MFVHEKLQMKLIEWNHLFENSDFEDGVSSKSWWKREFAKAYQIQNLKELVNWADWILDYTYDFAKSAYYVKEEIETLLKQIRRLK